MPGGELVYNRQLHRTGGNFTTDGGGNGLAKQTAQTGARGDYGPRKRRERDSSYRGSESFSEGKAMREDPSHPTGLLDWSAGNLRQGLPRRIEQGDGRFATKAEVIEKSRNPGEEASFEPLGYQDDYVRVDSQRPTARTWDALDAAGGNSD